MQTRMKLGLGSVLGTFGALGIVVGPALGAADLAWPLPFLTGFACGLSAGLGAALAIAGLIERRQEA